MTLLDVEELTRYWIAHPPLHLIVAAYLGIGESAKQTCAGPPAPASPANRKNLEVGAILAELGSSFTGGDVHMGLAPVVLDFAELKRKVSGPADA